MQLRLKKGKELELGCNHKADDTLAGSRLKGKQDKSSARIENVGKEVLLASGVFLAVVTIYINQSPKPSNWWALLALFSIPLILSLAVAVGYGSSKPYQRWIALGTVSAVMGKQLPSFVSVFFVFAGVTLFHLASQPEGIVSAVDNQGRLKAAMAAIFLALVLLFDNFFVWVVAATYEPGIYGTPQPLQDNGRRVQQYILDDQLGLSKRLIVLLRSIVNAQWALAASFSVALGVVDLQMVKNRTFWGTTIRAIFMLAALRTIRVVSFLMTVLPSQNPDCYRHRFPPPPNDWVSWIEIGMRPQSHGGCNDLIVSGHSTVLTTFACLAASISGHPLFAISIWFMLFIDFCIEVYEGFHYSVDMWMGVLIGTMMWRIMAPLEKVDSQVDITKRFKPLQSVTTSDVVAYTTPALVAYIDVIIVAHDFHAYVIIVFVVFAGIQAIRKGFTHHLQHVLVCSMFLALCVWL